MSPRTRRNLVAAVVGLLGLALVGLAVRDGRHYDPACRCADYHLSIPLLVVGGAIALFAAVLFDAAATKTYVQELVTVGGLVPTLRLGRRETDTLVVPPAPVAGPLPNEFGAVVTPVVVTPAPAPPEPHGVADAGTHTDDGEPL